MLRKIHIDQLLLFFVLSIALLILCFGSSLIVVDTNQAPHLTKYIDGRDMLHLPEQGVVSQNEVLKVYNPEMELWYSTDGGDHFEKSDGSIPVTAICNPDLKLIPASFHWKVPVGKFPAAHTVIVQVKHPLRAVVSEKITLTYFDEEHGDLPVISLSTAHKNLVSEKQGLFVFGESAYQDSGFYKNWWNRSANFQQRGIDWERAVNFSFFEAGKLVFQQDCGLRISGNATRGFPQKSLQLIARLNYGDDKFNFPFFGEEGNKKYASLVLRNSGNDNTKTMFADLLMQRLAEGSNLLLQKGKPVVVYINGNYWGIYNIRERIDVYLVAKHESVNEDEVTILEGANGQLKDGDDDIKAEFDALIAMVKSAAVGDKKIYHTIDEQVDLESFTDYVIFETYYANSDWPGNNSMWYKAGPEKWKWILNDLDYGMAYLGEKQVEADLFEKLRTSETAVSALFNFLMTVPEFKTSFKLRAAEILAGQLSEKRVAEQFAATKNQYETEIERHIRRWRMIDSKTLWEKNTEANYSFLVERSKIYQNQIDDL
ncbi:MAG: CotH kinase family protein [Bacteroidetes bacterium]|nr:CotH kinase family protein [Bacteroidota bacterium]